MLIAYEYIPFFMNIDELKHVSVVHKLQYIAYTF